MFVRVRRRTGNPFVAPRHRFLLEGLAALLSLVILTQPVLAQTIQSFTFTDDPLTASSSLVKAVHVTELRTAVNSLRASAGLAAFSFTDPTLTASSTQIKAVHVTELRNALNAVYDAVGQTRPTYTDATTLTASSTAVKKAHIAELRSAVNNVVISTGVTLTSLGSTSLMPSHVLTVQGTGFDATARMRVVFTDDVNHSVEVSATDVTTTSLKVAVPVWFTTAGAITAKTVSVKVEKIATTTTTSNTVTGFQVLAPPTSALSSGEFTKAFLQSARAENLLLETQGFSSDVQAKIDAANDKLALLIARIGGVQANPSSTFSMGTMGGTTLTIGASELAAGDRVFLSMVDALATGSGGSPTVQSALCVAAEASAVNAAVVPNGDYALKLRQLMYGFRANCDTYGKAVDTNAILNGTAFVAGGAVDAEWTNASQPKEAGAGPGRIAGWVFGAIVLYVLSHIFSTEAAQKTQADQKATEDLYKQAGFEVNKPVEKNCPTPSSPFPVVLVCSGDWLDVKNVAKDGVTTITTTTLPTPTPPPPPPTVTGISLTTNGVSGTATVSPVTANVSVTYSVVGTDGYTVSGTLATSTAGQITYGVEPACGGVVDSHVVTVAGGPSASTFFVWPACDGTITASRVTTR